MKAKATSVNTFVNNLLLGALTPGDKHFYVPIYEDVLTEIRDRLNYESNTYHTVYVMGQKGSGKTTALNYLPNEQLREQFEVVTLYANELFDLNDIDIAEVLLMICYQLMNGVPSLENKFRDRLIQIRNFIDGTRTETNESSTERQAQAGLEATAKLELNPITKLLNFFSANFNVFTNVRIDRNARSIVRDVFKVNPQQISALTNEIIEEYTAAIGKGEKKLLLIINELDHSRNSERITELFINNRHYIDNMRCWKVLSVPLILQTEGEFNESPACNIEYMGLKMTTNPLMPLRNDPREQALIERNWDFLRRLAYNRIDENTNLIEEKVIDEAIIKSGGLLRQYINILVDAGRRARIQKADQVTKLDVEEGIYRSRINVEGALIGRNLIALLEEVRTTHTTSANDKNLLIKCFLSNMILAFRNRPTWYSVNPLIEDTVAVYASSLSEEDE